MNEPSSWVQSLEAGAPDVVAAWRGIDEGRFISVRREVRRRAGDGSTERTVAQLGATAAALWNVVAGLRDDAFGLPGGEGDWNVAQAVGHVATARAGLVLAASLAAADRWPPDTAAVVPGVAGPADGDRASLIAKLQRSQRLIERAARAVSGHELDPCPLEHPLVGRLRCGEWLLFAGVHDLMHLEQLHGLAATTSRRHRLETRRLR
jgi:DinB superfamily